MIKRRVWFPGTTQVRKGMGLCYDLDVAGSGTGEAATDGWGRRGNSVAVPSTSNNLAFAGVASQDYPAKSNGQFIDIYEPGGMAEVAVGMATTIFSNSAGSLHTCSVNSADAGRFTLQGLSGRGTAIALQTKAAAAGGDIAFSVQPLADNYFDRYRHGLRLRRFEYRSHRVRCCDTRRSH